MGANAIAEVHEVERPWVATVTVREIRTYEVEVEVWASSEAEARSEAEDKAVDEALNCGREPGSLDVETVVDYIDEGESDEDEDEDEEDD